MLQKFDERNRELMVNINGRMVHRDQAGVSPFDSAVQGGDAVWEGLRLYSGRIFKLNEHLDRLRASAKAIGFTEIPTHEMLTEEIRRTLAANGMRDGVHVRLTLTRGVKYTSGMDPRLNTKRLTWIVIAEFKEPVYAKSGLALMTSSVRRSPPECLDAKIHHANLIGSIMAKIEANGAGADDAIMLDVRGFVAETNATNLFLVAGGGGGAGVGGGTPMVMTPRAVACPEGITRATVMEICGAEGIDCVERDLTLAEFYRANEVFCTGTMGELAGVTKIDGRVIGNGQVGRVTKRLSESYRQRTENEGVVVVGQ